MNNSDKNIDKEFEGLFEKFKEVLENDKKIATVVNLPRMEQLDFVYVAAKKKAKGKDVVVKKRIAQPLKTMGSVSIEGECIEFVGTEWFARLAEFANNTEIYPLVNNRIRITFTFHRLTVPIE